MHVIGGNGYTGTSPEIGSGAGAQHRQLILQFQCIVETHCTGRKIQAQWIREFDREITPGAFASCSNVGIFHFIVIH